MNSMTLVLANQVLFDFQVLHQVEDVSRIMKAEDKISEVQDRMVEINESERKKEKQIKRNEENLRDLWDNVKRPNI